VAIRVPGGHVGGAGAVVRVVEVMCGTVKAAPSGWYWKRAIVAEMSEASGVLE